MEQKSLGCHSDSSLLQRAALGNSIDSAKNRVLLGAFVIVLSQ